MAVTMMADVPTLYYVGKTKVTSEFWHQMPDSIDYITSEFNYDTVVVKARELPLTHYIDSVSRPGGYVLCKRSPEAIAELEQIFAMINQERRAQSLGLSVGDAAPQIELTKYKNGCDVDDFIVPGRCYLLSFWATWCGHCLQELKPDFIPYVANKFTDNPDFHFVPVCIDTSSEELDAFFKSDLGRKWLYLSDITYLDTDRKANEKFGESGIMPLNVVIGKDGSIRYIQSGALKDEAQLTELSEAIQSAL